MWIHPSGHQSRRFDSTMLAYTRRIGKWSFACLHFFRYLMRTCGIRACNCFLKERHSSLDFVYFGIASNRDSTTVQTHQSAQSNRNVDRTGKHASNLIPSITVSPTDGKAHPFVDRTQNTFAGDCSSLDRPTNSIIDLAFFQHELRDRHKVGDKAIRRTDIPAAMRSNPNRCDRGNVLPITAITKQPLPFSKDSSTAGLHEDIDIHPANGEALNSITCPQCKRCRCEECQRPRQLPSRWVCDNTCLCSAET